MTWVPRSQRLGTNNYDGPFEGVPDHLQPHIVKWLTTQISALDKPKSAAASLAMRLRIEVPPYYADSELIRLAGEDEDLLFDCVEGVLRMISEYKRPTAAQSFNQLLQVSGSAYKVINDLDIVDLTSEEVEAVRVAAVAAPDAASDELSEAWTNAFGRSPDPSDAWDHAIKSVEAVLQPVVEANNTKATLGSMIAVLVNSPAKWECAFPGVNKDHDVTNLVATLRLIWPNPDRHGPVTRKPTLQEARAVVTLAATVVQWHREGYIVRKR